MNVTNALSSHFPHYFKGRGHRQRRYCIFRGRSRECSQTRSLWRKWPAATQSGEKFGQSLNLSQESGKSRIKALYEGVVRSLRKDLEPPRARVTSRNRRFSSRFLHPRISGVTPVSADKVPLLHLKRKVGISWEYSSNLTGVYLDILHEIATSGTTFKDKTRF